MRRRDFLKLLFGGLSLTLFGCGANAGGNSSNSSQPFSLQKAIKFGLGPDPERMIDDYDPAGYMVLNTLTPNIVCMWINGAALSNGSVYSSSMEYVRNWAQEKRFAEWSQKGYELMVITWENYDGQNSTLGGPTYGNYHISNQFIQDMTELLGYLKAQFSNQLYFALATEQSTYTGCRYNHNICGNQQEEEQYSDIINSTTEEYFSQLRTNLQKAASLIEAQIPSAYVGMSFGGWLVNFQNGIDFIHYFDSVINESTAVFFQSMIGEKASENNGYGNPQQIMKNCQFYQSYGKPIILSHYMPSSLRADVVADDMQTISAPSYLENLDNYLYAFCFMDYGILKDNQYNCLTYTQNFRKELY